MKVAVDVLDSPSLIVLTVSVDVKQTLNTSGPEFRSFSGSPGGRPGLPVPSLLVVSVDAQQH